MAFPYGITKDTSARKGPSPVAPHDAALQAYMQSFVASIDYNTALAEQSRHSEHVIDVDGLRRYFTREYNDALRELKNKYAEDLRALNGERNAKVAELRIEFAKDPLATIVTHQNAATGRTAQRNASAQQDPQTRSANVDAAVARAAAIKQEPVEEETRLASTRSPLAVLETDTEKANLPTPLQPIESPRELENARANEDHAEEVAKLHQHLPEVELTSASGGVEGLQDCQDLIEVKQEVISAGAENSVVAVCDNQTQGALSFERDVASLSRDLREINTGSGDTAQQLYHTTRACALDPCSCPPRRKRDPPSSCYAFFSRHIYSPSLLSVSLLAKPKSVPLSFVGAAYLVRPCLSREKVPSEVACNIDNVKARSCVPGHWMELGIPPQPSSSCFISGASEICPVLGSALVKDPVVLSKFW
ncbi:hypothetical protein CERZMDRAFT_82159 [Cercospora zeae-maydis SCOH1-5]|uniref:Uncharacterized protein n=1 Tax=Cercospora zeae-maydis SCOH1-5 TaxID=717836 RepID=A0A6A6FP43_9PEZI|nr:hypothetical protein CERZMDRAFT_82159 [Cercospora zeae-maydis SCOH1-5]